MKKESKLLQKSKPISKDERRQILLSLVSKPQNETTHYKSLIDELIIEDITPILNKKGKHFNVKSGKKDRRTHKPNECFMNSGQMMIYKGYGYVEGLCTHKTEGYSFSHSWNVNNSGNHLDFTLDDPENFDYLGIVIPNNIVNDVLRGLGGVWTSVLVHYKDF